MAFVLYDDALGADVYLVVFTEELGSLIGVLQAVFLGGQLLLLQLLLLLLGANVPLTVEVVEYCEVLDQLLDVRAEVAPARRAGQDVARAEVHEAVLTESVAAGEDARDFFLVVVLIEADGTSDFHPVNVAC